MTESVVLYPFIAAAAIAGLVTGILVYPLYHPTNALDFGEWIVMTGLAGFGAAGVTYFGTMGSFLLIGNVYDRFTWRRRQQ